jgi:hypothetical protein
VSLNLGEASGQFGGHRKQRFRTAVGSAREVVACLDTAEAFGYIAPVDAELRDLLGKVIATLINLSR